MGLIVLGLFAIYLLVTALLAWGFAAIGRRTNQPWMKKRWVWLVMFLIPTWDMPIGYFNFKRYCDAEAGIEVYRRVGLGDEFYISQGKELYKFDHLGVNRKMEATGDELDIKKVKSHFDVMEFVREKDISRWGYIDRLETVVKNDGEVLGRVTSYKGGGGWLDEYLGSAGAGYVGADCPKDAITGQLHDLKIYDKIFYRERDGMSEGAKNAYIYK